MYNGKRFWYTINLSKNEINFYNLIVILNEISIFFVLSKKQLLNI